MRSSLLTAQRSYSVLLYASLALAGCSGDNGPSEPENGGDGADATVQVINNSFNPPVAAVPVNGTVLWQWNSGGVEHNVTFPDSPDSPTQGSGTFERTFSTPGEFDYVCTIHAAQGMVGTINVTDGAGGGSGGGADGGGGGGYP